MIDKGDLVFFYNKLIYAENRNILNISINKVFVIILLQINMIYHDVDVDNFI